MAWWVAAGILSVFSVALFFVVRAVFRTSRGFSSAVPFMNPDIVGGRQADADEWLRIGREDLP